MTTTLECRKADHAYPTERDAQIALVECIIQANLGNKRRRERAHYQCPRCGLWHLTSQPQRRPRHTENPHG